MSTKKTLKRISLVAVSAMGFGLMSMVPANAAANRALTAVTVTSTTAAVAVGATGSSTFSVTVGDADLVSADEDTAKVELVLSVPVGSSVALDDYDGAGSGDVYDDTALSAEFASGAYAASKVTLTVDDADIAAEATEFAGTVRIKPDVAGTYTLTIYPLAANGTTRGTASTFTVYGGAGTATAIAVARTTLDDGTALAASKYTSNAVLDALQISAFSVEAGSEVTLHVTAVGGTFLPNDDIRVSMRGYGIIDDWAAADATADGAESNNNVFTVTSVPGTYTLDLVLRKDGTAAIGTDLSASVTMTVTAPSAFSGSLSTAFIKSGNTETAADADTDVVTASGSATAATENRGSILLTMKNGLGAAMASGNAVTAQITSGPGYLVALTADTPTDDQCSATPTFSATVGRAISAFDPGAIANLIICADGTAGVATIKISVTNQLVTTTDWSTKTFTFYGAVRSLSVAAANYTVGVAGGDTTGAAEDAIVSANYLLSPVDDTTDVPAIIIAAKDSAGQLATAANAPTVISSNLNVVSSGTCELDDGSGVYSSGEGFGVYNCSFTTSANAVSGQSATLTFRIADPLGTAGVDYLTTTQVVTVGGARYTETVSLNKASYGQGEAMVVTRTAKDSAGNPVYDGATAPAVVFNKAIGGTAPAASWYTNGSVATSSTKPTVFAPTASGVFEARITGYNGSKTTTSAIIATATVGDDAATAAANAASDAAAEAIDAANAATDAANLAAEAADAATVAAEEARDAADAATAAVEELATQVATLMAALKAQITTLANTVAKIAKKVKA